MRLYLDDVRNPPPGDWTVVRNTREAQRVLENSHEPCTHMSLDHDLGMQYCRMCAFRDVQEPCFDDNGARDCDCSCHVEEPSGYEFLKWVHEHNRWPVNRPTVHSANPGGAARMEAYINDFGPYPR